MASAPQPMSGSMPPPPGGTSPIASSPAKASPNPKMDQQQGLVLQIVQGVRALAVANAAFAPYASRINDIISEAGPKLLASMKPEEPAAPPVAG